MMMEILLIQCIVFRLKDVGYRPSFFWNTRPKYLNTSPSSKYLFTLKYVNNVTFLHFPVQSTARLPLSVRSALLRHWPKKPTV